MSDPTASRPVPEGVGAFGFERGTDGTVLLRLAGRWSLQHWPADADDIGKRLRAQPQLTRITFNVDDLGAWDSSLLVVLVAVKNACAENGIEFDATALPAGLRRLLDLAAAVPERKDARRSDQRQPFLAAVGAAAIDLRRSFADVLSFLGEATLSIGRLFVGRARFRASDLALTIQECGVQALPIVSLISILVGLILAFVGAVQLEQFGAQIYVANLVGIAMVREMGAMMAAIIMAGRTGAAFAAQLGTMQVNEEIDALKTLGFPPMDFLVLPRMTALVLMMPLLCLYADLLGILGGLIVGVGMLDLTFTQYLHQTQSAIELSDVAYGVVKSSIFGILVAVSGCLRGIQCGRSASAVGEAATSAVVMAIVLIIVTDGLFAVLSNLLGI